MIWLHCDELCCFTVVTWPEDVLSIVSGFLILGCGAFVQRYVAMYSPCMDKISC